MFLRLSCDSSAETAYSSAMSQLERSKAGCAFLLAALTLTAGFAQQARMNLPVLRPTVTVLGEAPSDLLPFDSVSLSPDGQLIVYCTTRDVHIWHVATHEDAV